MYTILMPNLIARHMPELGQEMTVRTSLLAKVGSAFSVIFSGRRVGLARVIKDFSKDERYHIEVHGHGLTNMAKNMVRMKVERVYDQDE